MRLGEVEIESEDFLNHFLLDHLLDLIIFPTISGSQQFLIALHDFLYFLQPRYRLYYLPYQLLLRIFLNKPLNLDKFLYFSPAQLPFVAHKYCLRPNSTFISCSTYFSLFFMWICKRPLKWLSPWGLFFDLILIISMVDLNSVHFLL